MVKWPTPIPSMIMCMAIRFPGQYIPLRNVKAATIIKALRFLTCQNIFNQINDLTLCQIRARIKGRVIRFTAALP